MSAEIREQILQTIKMIADDLACYEISNTITLETRFKEDLGFDSLDMVEFTIMLENEMNIDIPEFDHPEVELATVGKAVDSVMEVIQEDYLSAFSNIEGGSVEGFSKASEQVAKMLQHA